MPNSFDKATANPAFDPCISSLLAALLLPIEYYPNLIAKMIFNKYVCLCCANRTHVLKHPVNIPTRSDSSQVEQRQFPHQYYTDLPHYYTLNFIKFHVIEHTAFNIAAYNGRTGNWTLLLHACSNICMDILDHCKAIGFVKCESFYQYKFADDNGGNESVCSHKITLRNVVSPLIVTCTVRRLSARILYVLLTSLLSLTLLLGPLYLFIVNNNHKNFVLHLFSETVL